MTVLVAYTGTETKIIQNLGKYRYKRSRIEKRTNETLIINLVILVLFISAMSIANGVITKKLFEDHFYLTDNNDKSSSETTLLAVVSFYILNNYLVPLDLAVCLEFIQLFYFGFILSDAKMTNFNREMGRIDSCKINSLNLMDNLGEVTYIMSDKTGTMTKNELTFVAACADEHASHRFAKTHVVNGKNVDSVTDETLGDYLKDKSEFNRCV